MTTFLGIINGKGGVGKTTTSVNLAFCLKDKYKIVLLEGNLQNPHIGLHLGRHNPKHTIHTTTLKKHHIAKAVHDMFGINVVMGSLNAKYDESNLKNSILGLYQFGEKVIIDCPPGDYTNVLRYCDECILVTTPDPVSISETYIAKNTAKKLAVDVLGVVVNRVRKDSDELSNRQISNFLSLPVLVNIPEDRNIHKALIKKQPVVHYKPRSKSSRAFIKLAEYIQ